MNVKRNIFKNVIKLKIIEKSFKINNNDITTKVWWDTKLSVAKWILYYSTEQIDEDFKD